MPLHDWTNDAGWDGFHILWITHLFHAIKPHVPPEFRAYLGSVPALSVAAVTERPDISVRQWPDQPAPESDAETNGSAGTYVEEPDIETATITLDPQQALHVTYRGRLVAAIELISPRNKNRVSARATYLARYLGYLKNGANLLLVDVHRRPLNFSFADALARELQVEQPVTPAPLAVAYRVGGPAATGGLQLSIWRRPLQVGSPLPTMTLPLTGNSEIRVNLEDTYMQAAADVYLA